MKSRYLKFIVSILIALTMQNAFAGNTTQIKSGFYSLFSELAVSRDTASVGNRETGVKWTLVEPSNNRYDWTYLDSKILLAQQENKELVVVLEPGRRGPFSSWPPVQLCIGSGSVNCALLDTSSARAEWEEFLKNVFERYDFDGVRDMPGLKRAFKNWEIGNEFENSEQFGGTKEEYVVLLKGAYDAKKASSPTPTLILGGILFPEKLGRCYSNPGGPDCSEPTVIFQKYYLENAKDASGYYYDVIDLHFFNWFSYQPGLIKDAVRGVKLTPSGKPLVSLEWTAAFGLFDHPNKPLWQVSTNRPLNGDCDADGVQDSWCKEGNLIYDIAQTNFEKDQGEDFVRVFTSLVGQGLGQLGMTYVQFSDWHPLWCFSPAWNYQGLLRRAVPANVCNENYTGSDTLIAKKPAYFNYQKLMQYLDNYSSVTEISPCSGSGCYGYKFIVGGETRIVIWSASLTSPVSSVDLSSHFGNADVCYYNMVTHLDGGLRPIVPGPKVYSGRAVDVSVTPAIVTKRKLLQSCPSL